MSQPLAYIDGRFAPAAEACVPVTDAGFMQGATVAEQLRTFNGRLFHLDDHLRRLAHSLDVVGVEPPQPLERLGEIAEELAANNHALLAEGDDLGLSLFITPGTYSTFDPAGDAAALVGMHTYPLPFRLWADKYERGQSLRTTRFRQTPPECWPPELKCRSRMHYYLADKQAREVEPGSRALLLDIDGFVAEASTANAVCYFEGEGLVAPPQEKILPGVSMRFLDQLAAEQDVAFVHRDLTLEEARRADELLLCSTSPCVWSVVRLDGEPIDAQRPGPLARRLLAAWSERVGVDIVEQAKRFAER